MSTRARSVGACALAIGLAAAVAACGGSSSSSNSNSGGAPTTKAKNGGTVTVLMGTAPDYLDPQLGYTTQAAEPDWITYTPLYTYAHKSGQPGGQVIPGIAQAFPQVTNGGKTYTLSIRKGLT